MSKPSERKRQKHDKRRALAKQRAKEHELPQSYGDLIRFASARPFGPAWVAVGYDEDDAEGVPQLLTVVVTRRLPSGLLLAGTALVDRTCLGIKNAYVMQLAAETETAKRVAHIGEQQGQALRPCDLELAQSIVFHALDYAKSLGFAPHADFEASLFGPRPAVLAPTRWARPTRPCYVSGLDDDVRAIVRRLDRLVGRDGYEFLRGLDDSDDEDDDGWLPDDNDSGDGRE